MKLNKKDIAKIENAILNSGIEMPVDFLVECIKMRDGVLAMKQTIIISNHIEELIKNVIEDKAYPAKIIRTGFEYQEKKIEISIVAALGEFNLIDQLNEIGKKAYHLDSFFRMLKNRISIHKEYALTESDISELNDLLNDLNKK